MLQGISSGARDSFSDSNQVRKFNRHSAPRVKRAVHGDDRFS
jgi:hypothetical protein